VNSRTDYADIDYLGRSMRRLNVLSNIPIGSRTAARRHADMDLVTRLAGGSITYLFLLLLLGTASPFRVDHPVMFWNAALAIALAGSIRIFLFVLRKQLYSRGRFWILVPMFLSIALSAGTAGLIHVNIMKSYGFSTWTFALIEMWILGIGAGSTITFTPSFSLLTVQLVVLFGPALPYDLLTSAPHGLSHGFSQSVFVGFLLVQGYRLHALYWERLSDRAIEMQRTKELEAAKTAAERAQEQLRYQATHDVLTGVMNRAEILRVFAREVERAIRLGTQLGVLMIDLDDFKQVNDRFGHLAGDDVLRRVAERVANNLRSYDSLGRFGGEEFLVILPSCDLEQCATTAERIRLAIESDPAQLPQAPAKVTASFGVTVLDPMADTDRQMIARADIALYEAKKNGRNRVAVQLPGLDSDCFLQPQSGPAEEAYSS
jgi:diguanylate cyclase (GGDEF)-like protein